jgi:hypothetical protein
MVSRVRLKSISMSDFNRFYAGQSVYLTKANKRYDFTIERVRPKKMCLLLSLNTIQTLTMYLSLKDMTCLLMTF